MGATSSGYTLICHVLGTMLSNFGRFPMNFDPQNIFFSFSFRPKIKLKICIKYCIYGQICKCSQYESDQICYYPHIWSGFFWKLTVPPHLKYWCGGRLVVIHLSGISGGPPCLNCGRILWFRRPQWWRIYIFLAKGARTVKYVSNIVHMGKFANVATRHI